MDEDPSFLQQLFAVVIIGLVSLMLAMISGG